MMTSEVKYAHRVLDNKTSHFEGHTTFFSNMVMPTKTFKSLFAQANSTMHICDRLVMKL